MMKIIFLLRKNFATLLDSGIINKTRNLVFYTFLYQKQKERSVRPLLKKLSFISFRIYARKHLSSFVPLLVRQSSVPRVDDKQFYLSRKYS